MGGAHPQPFIVSSKFTKEPKLVFLLSNEGLIRQVYFSKTSVKIFFLIAVGKNPGSRNCAARQRALQIILRLADKSSKRYII